MSNPLHGRPPNSSGSSSASSSSSLSGSSPISVTVQPGNGGHNSSSSSSGGGILKEKVGLPPVYLNLNDVSLIFPCPRWLIPAMSSSAAGQGSVLILMFTFATLGRHPHRRRLAILTAQCHLHHHLRPGRLHSVPQRAHLVNIRIPWGSVFGGIQLFTQIFSSDGIEITANSL